MRSYILTVVKMFTVVFWVVTPCSLVGGYQRFEGTVSQTRRPVSAIQLHGLKFKIQNSTVIQLRMLWIIRVWKYVLQRLTIIHSSLPIFTLKAVNNILLVQAIAVHKSWKKVQTETRISAYYSDQKRVLWNHVNEHIGSHTSIRRCQQRVSAEVHVFLSYSRRTLEHCLKICHDCPPKTFPVHIIQKSMYLIWL
jgi:hypothetical protein